MLPAQQSRGRGTASCPLERGEPAAVEHDARRPRPVFGKSPDRADHRIVIGCLDRYAEAAGNFLGVRVRETLSQILGGRRAIRERIGNRGELRGCDPGASRAGSALSIDKAERLGRRSRDLGDHGASAVANVIATTRAMEECRSARWSIRGQSVKLAAGDRHRLIDRIDAGQIDQLAADDRRKYPA